MPSVRMQIFAAVAAKLELVRAGLDWNQVIRNPRELVGEDQYNTLVMMDGGAREPDGLSGYVQESELEFSVAVMVMERNGDLAEDLLDAGFVAVSNKLVDPTDIQLGGIAIGIRRTGMSDPVIGRSPHGARVVGGQSIDFAVKYLEREGDAELPGP